MANKNKYDFGEYIKKYPNKKEVIMGWKSALGLLDLKSKNPSEYLLGIINKTILDEIDFKEAEVMLSNHYKKGNKNQYDIDLISLRIAEILSDGAFSLSFVQLSSIHKRIFQGISKKAGKIRKINILENEEYLNNDRVFYSSFESIKEELEYELDKESKFSYKELSNDEFASHMGRFISRIWKIHPFEEGNTEAIAVFLIKYLLTFGFDLNNEVFAKNSMFFRNSLLRANYKNYEKNIHEDFTHIEKFIHNLALEKKHKLELLHTHVDYKIKKKIKKIENRLSLEEKAIINAIRENRNIKQEEIAENIARSLRTVKTKMKQMQDKGLIARVNGKRDGEWIVL